jgi:hypothetical protein
VRQHPPCLLNRGRSSISCRSALSTHGSGIRSGCLRFVGSFRKKELRSMMFAGVRAGHHCRRRMPVFSLVLPSRLP